MASIVWAPRALDDIDALILYISSDSAIRARRFASRMISRIDSLASQPESGSWLPEDDGRQYRQIFHGTYRVVYRFTNDTVVIVAIHHSARQFDIEVL